MKKTYWLIVFLVLFAGTLFAQISANSDAWVSVESANLKSSTWFFASNNGIVRYGNQVRVLQVSGNWAQVQTQATPRLTGWISTNNLVTRRITGTGSGVTASETAQAGRGFNRDVENAYRANSTLNYGDVDRMEMLEIGEQELLGFLRDGRLTTGESR